MERMTKLEKIADKYWPEMIRTLEEKGADFAFDVFMESLIKAEDIR